MASDLDFAALVNRIKLNLGVDSDEICRRVGIGSVSLKNYISGYVEPPHAVAEKMLQAYAVSYESGLDYRPLLMPKTGLKEIDVDEIKSRLAAPKHFAVAVNDDALANRRIFSNSYAVIRLNQKPADGSIVLISLDGGKALLYEYFSTDNTVRLVRADEEHILTADEFAGRCKFAGCMVYNVSSALGGEIFC